MFNKLLSIPALIAFALVVAPSAAEAEVLPFGKPLVGQTFGGKQKHQQPLPHLGGKPKQHKPQYGQPIGTQSCKLHRICVPQNIWVPAHHEQVQKQVWVPGKTEMIWIEPVYQTHCDFFGFTYKVLVEPGHWQPYTHPGHYQTVIEHVLVPGHYEPGCVPVSKKYKGAGFKGYGGYGKHGGYGS